MRALVTGPTGFIGSHLVEELLGRKYSVHCLVREHSDLRWLHGLDVTCHKGDCRDPESLLPAVAGADYVFHLAGITRAQSLKEYREVNAVGTENLIEAVLRHAPGLRRFVFLSSLSAVGPNPGESPVDEETEPRPISDYGHSKLLAERLLHARAQTLPITILRAPAVYGPRDRDFHVLYKMLNRRVFLDWGRSYYSLIYVDDLAGGLVDAAEAQGAEGETFFLTQSGALSNLDIAGAISKSLGKDYIRLYVPKAIMPAAAAMGQYFSRNRSIINRDRVKEFGHKRWVCDGTKAGRAFGFSPPTSASEGFKWTADWYRAHQWL